MRRSGEKPYSAGVGEEVGTEGLEHAVDGRGDGGVKDEVGVGFTLPLAGEGGERRGCSHCVCREWWGWGWWWWWWWWWWEGEGEGGDDEESWR